MRQLVHRLVEIVQRGGGDAVIAEAEIDLVEIKLEDLVLRIGGFDAQASSTSWILRSTVRSLLSRKFLATCWVMVEAPWTWRLALDEHRSRRA